MVIADFFRQWEAKYYGLSTDWSFINGVVIYCDITTR
jgi:hypothetical protein